MDLTVSQHENERSRVIVNGHRTDDGDQCTVVAAHERTGHWVIYPHGWGKFGVRLPATEALTVAHAIIAAHR